MRRNSTKPHLTLWMTYLALWEMNERSRQGVKNVGRISKRCSTHNAVAALWDNTHGVRQLYRGHRAYCEEKIHIKG
ncbi:hypothetical protein Scep_004551 [Stephania cephalantha]|uniref:Uncharacterized protein n=1 Tax=Stephania cephalantha TaxID=152367 RepID=A0AAP0KSN6_9MAGN